jgi:hypothetical protein
MFIELTRPRSGKNVVLATTMWDTLGSSPDDGNEQEELERGVNTMISRYRIYQRWSRMEGRARCDDTFRHTLIFTFTLASTL